MENKMTLTDKVKALIEDDEHYTAYQIAKSTGVNQANITQLRNGNRKVERLSLAVAEKLGKFWEEQMMKKQMDKETRIYRNAKFIDQTEVDEFVNHYLTKYRDLISSSDDALTNHTQAVSCIKQMKRVLKAAPVQGFEINADQREIMETIIEEDYQEIFRQVKDSDFNNINVVDQWQLLLGNKHSKEYQEAKKRAKVDNETVDSARKALDDLQNHND
ncbi:hypothetical protein [Pediococcus acidilactici]|uniref:hypothetical protein n=1 Tax=Pediococcus acidilactici TaxID=1254 RepID=UPI001BD3587F|nr:hypothetical protein [Pediococcus acidilactici]MBS9400113.1 hypothetical protein [Pediococcus acidilactici]